MYFQTHSKKIQNVDRKIITFTLYILKKIQNVNIKVTTFPLEMTLTNYITNINKLYMNNNIERLYNQFTD